MPLNGFLISNEPTGSSLFPRPRIDDPQSSSRVDGLAARTDSKKKFLSTTLDRAPPNILQRCPSKPGSRIHGIPPSYPFSRPQPPTIFALVTGFPSTWYPFTKIFREQQAERPRIGERFSCSQAEILRETEAASAWEERGFPVTFRGKWVAIMARFNRGNHFSSWSLYLSA